MGGSGSKDSQLDRYGKQLSRAEKEAVSKCFLAIAGSETAQSFGEGQLKAYLSDFSVSLPTDLSSRLFRVLATEGQATAGQVSFAQFVSNSCQLLKGTLTQRAPLIYQLCSAPSVTLKTVESTLLAFLSSLHSSEAVLSVYPHVGTWAHSEESSKLLVSHFLGSLRERSQQGQDGDSDSDVPVSLSSFEAWLRSLHLAVRILDVSLGVCFYREVIRKGRQIPPDILNYFGVDIPDPDSLVPVSYDRQLLPVKTQHPNFRESFQSSLLDRDSLMLLNHFIPSGNKGELFPLFSSLHHGESFSTFCKGLVGCGGPTLIVVRDTGGHVFGGYAAEKWQFNPQFTGNPNCFLFSLRPKLAVFTPTGYNENYMYLQQNAQTLPNGLGMGGQVEYFGFWISGDFGAGHSKARPKCTTYNSPMLSSEEEFRIDTLELWGVGRPVVPDQQAFCSKFYLTAVEKNPGWKSWDGPAQPSILDKDKVANTLLEMAGKTRHSEGLREPEEDS